NAALASMLRQIRNYCWIELIDVGTALTVASTVITLDVSRLSFVPKLSTLKGLSANNIPSGVRAKALILHQGIELPVYYPRLPGPAHSAKCEVAVDPLSLDGRPPPADLGVE